MPVWLGVLSGLSFTIEKFVMNGIVVHISKEGRREKRSSRFKVHDKTGNRKLLWHGTNVAVVAAILKSGLRIMPHSGGRVGAGIYFASENGKSAAYVGTVGKTSIMFLNEVALGKQHIVKMNQSHLKAAPAGYDSVLAIGCTEPVFVSRLREADHACVRYLDVPYQTRHKNGTIGYFALGNTKQALASVL